MTKAKLITSKLHDHLVIEMDKASTICLLTSFVMKSGVDLIRPVLLKAAVRGADIKICCGDYLFVTQPSALKQLIQIHPNIEVRLWKSNGIAFHPKAYLFKIQENGTVFIGSSNLSKSALTSGIEWNVFITEDQEVFEDALSQFTKIMYSEQTVVLNNETVQQYEKEYYDYHQRNPNLVRNWTESEEIEMMLPTNANNEKEKTNNNNLIFEENENYSTKEIKPRDAQILALQELENTLEEGYKRALVVMATGLGKTYLAAFFAKHFNRILFVAHREEILNQAKNSFLNVLPDKKVGIYNGKKKEGHADIVFASIFTLSLKQHIENFAPDDFDLIVIDEFHHAAAKTYQKVLEYFNPNFLLGITATPDRNDNKNVFAICDGNVAYRIDFIEAIQRSWLAPFHYFGVYDETDYSQLRWIGNKYVEEDLLQVQLREEMAEKIYEAWINYKQTQTLVFCSSVRQADFLSNYFNTKGQRTISLHSQTVGISRETAIKMLSNNILDAIFTVDLFNEGVDIPSVDTLLFVRPTESLTVFTQQIGRGLRLNPRKSHCVIIDLIGNYRNADIKLSLFDTEPGNKKRKSIIPSVPENCIINIDLAAINLLDELQKKKQPRKEKLRQDYFDLKLELGKRPTYLELHLLGKSSAVEYKQEFGSYFAFLYWAGELSKIETEIFHRYEKWFIEVEKTVMTKSYKMVVLLSMLERGINDWNNPITSREVAQFFHRYLTEVPFRKKIDFSDKESKRLWKYDENRVSKLIEDMPMTKWSSSSNGLVYFNDGVFGFNFDILEEDREIIFDWTKQICECRLHQHFERKSKVNK